MIRLGLALALATFPCLAVATAETVPAPGLYQVEVNLDLPHLEGMGASRTATICIDASPTRGLVVLSENNPLAKCPVSNSKSDGRGMTFEVHCEGKNEAEGFAKYQLFAERFEGTIVMKMGGKNMTMTETQKGKRVNDCPPPESH